LAQRTDGAAGARLGGTPAAAGTPMNHGGSIIHAVSVLLKSRAQGCFVVSGQPSAKHKVGSTAPAGHVRVLAIGAAM